MSPHKSSYKMLITLFALLLFHKPLPINASSRDLAKQQLAIRAAAKEALDNLTTIATTNATDITILTADLRDTMLQDAKRHCNNDKSRSLCKNILIVRREAATDTILEEVIQHASVQSPLPITKDNVLAKLGSDWNQQATLAAETFAERFITPIYTEARTDAIARQRSKIKKTVSYPAFKDLDAKLTEQTDNIQNNNKILTQRNFNNLLPWIKSSITSESFVFDENQATVKQLGKKILKDIQTQYEQQITITDNIITNNKVPTTAILKNEIEKFMTTKLTAGIQSIKSTTDNRPYPSFNASQQYITYKAGQLQNKRLQAFISKPNTISIGNNAERIIKDSLAAHRNPKTSKETFRQFYNKQQCPIIAEKYVVHSGKNKSTDTLSAIKNLIQNNPEINKTFQQQIDINLEKILPPIRESIAQEQFSNNFPDLAKKTPFTELMIEFLYDQQTTNIKSIAILTKLLATDSAYTTQKQNKSEMLKETVTLAINTANELAEPFILALGAQLQILHKLEQDNMEQLRQDIAAKRPLKEIKQNWKNQLLQRWKEQSNNYPKQAQILFKRTETQLDKTVRQLYDTTKAEQIKQEQTEPIKTAEVSGGKKTTSYDSEKTEVPDPEKEQEEKEPKEEEPNDDKNSGIEEDLTLFKGSADFVLRLSDAPDGRCRVIFGCPAKGTSLEAHFMPTEIETAADIIATAINEQFAETLQSLAQSSQSHGIMFWKKTTPRIRVLVLENSKETRHITSILLQKKIKEQIKTWSQKENLKFRLDWQESPILISD